MHVELLKKHAVDFDLIDHIDGNGLNNQKANLRPANKMTNSTNRSKQRGYYSSQYKGVTFCRHWKKFKARVVHQNKVYFCGYFMNEKDAALAYNKKAFELHKEFAKLNNV